MISYRQCEEMVGVKPEYPTKEYGYHAYKSGYCKVFKTKREAAEFSSLVEKFVVNEEEFKEKLNEFHDYETKVQLFWFNELRAEFDLPEKVFNVCYAEAYERGHSSGYDSVANCMYDVVEFYEKIMRAIDE